MKLQDMNIHICRHIQAKKLSRSVCQYLQHRYALSNQYLNNLRSFQFDGLFDGQPVKKILIFDSLLAKKHGIDIKTNLDLDQHKGVLAFEGHIDRSGKLYFADRRPATCLLKDIRY